MRRFGLICVALALGAAGCDSEDTTATVGNADGTSGVDVSGSDAGGTGDAVTTPDQGAPPADVPPTPDVPPSVDIPPSADIPPTPDVPPAQDATGDVPPAPDLPGVDVPEPPDVPESDVPEPPDVPEADVPEPDVPEPDTGGPDIPEVPCGAFGQACCDGACDAGLTCVEEACTVVVETCADGDCVSLPPGTPDATITTVAGEPDPLTGGALPSVVYELDEVEVYSEVSFGQLAGLITISSNGNTSGAIGFEGDDRWGLTATLDLQVAGDIFGSSFNEGLFQSFSLGGCYVVVDNAFGVELVQACGAWSLPTPPPSAFEYESANGQMSLILVLSKAFIKAGCKAKSFDKRYEGRALDTTASQTRKLANQ